MKRLIYIGLVVLIAACNTKEEITTFTTPENYNNYLNTEQRPSYDVAFATQKFWSKRLDTDTTGIGDIGPLAGAYEGLFNSTGNVQYLKDVEALYLRGIEISANNKDGFARGLAHNFISQHRFKEAYVLLNQTYTESSHKQQTELMLFDAAMEVGDYDNAYKFLRNVKNLSDYNYLIRASKWSDHRGDLDNAISLMEDAMSFAESRDSKPLKIWTYSNLGDYYGHAGRIDEAYSYYLKTLSLQPDNDYVKKGIAWIAYSAEGNTKEAHRILDSISLHHKVPDYDLLRAELYEFDGEMEKAEDYKNSFIEKASHPNYGAMYNAYLIALFADSDAEKALVMARIELENRATPETYHLLALAQLATGAKSDALKTIETFVEGKTSEPMALYHSALVFKANDFLDKVIPIKEELMEASFELGPLLMQEIEKL